MSRQTIVALTLLDAGYCVQLSGGGLVKVFGVSGGHAPLGVLETLDDVKEWLEELATENEAHRGDGSGEIAALPVLKTDWYPTMGSLALRPSSLAVFTELLESAESSRQNRGAYSESAALKMAQEWANRTGIRIEVIDARTACTIGTATPGASEVKS